jgi:hypothetical protein
MYFGGTIMTFALPYGAFIAAAVALFYLFRARHSGPRLRWSLGSAAQVSSVSTREPGPASAPEVTSAAPASDAAPASEPAAPAGAAPADAAPAGAVSAPGPAGATPAAATANDSPQDDSPPDNSPEGKDGEPG